MTKFILDISLGTPWPLLVFFQTGTCETTTTTKKGFKKKKTSVWITHPSNDFKKTTKT